MALASSRLEDFFLKFMRRIPVDVVCVRQVRDGRRAAGVPPMREAGGFIPESVADYTQ
ncbi:hypothetical protein GCM10007363_12430 [Pseudomonas fluvialis]|uniref:Uncharacterized protein n=1 Tax=Pseudomonas fluvialis TaxID=1793966 RepID=A0ABQ2AIT7_9PSED|nr:hypothetical protein GCM10007363_12430 [Pseudomonas fluvialis]